MRRDSTTPGVLALGDILPKLVFAGPRGEAVDLTAPPMAGRANLLVIVGNDTGPAAALLAELAGRRAAFEKTGARCFLVTRSPATSGSGSPGQRLPGLGGPRPGLPGLGAAPAGFARVPAAAADIGELKAGAMRLVDHDGALYSLAGLDGGGVGLLTIGPNQHVIDLAGPVGGATDAAAAVATALDYLECRAARRETGAPGIHPPILSVPDVFSPADCAHLMSIFHTRGQDYVEPGHLALGQRTTDCKMRIPDLGRRDRIDHWVVEADTHEFIGERLRTRLFPEIAKAYNYPITKHERYRIARYQGERGGEQMGHRDNIEATVAHRRFAVTINLNAEDYEGAELRFPEFSDQLYKPASGTAAVFSCSLLHEVVGMRRGSRFALLAFLFGDR